MAALCLPRTLWPVTMKSHLILLATCVAIAGGTLAPQPSPPPGWVRSEVHFGLSCPDGTFVSAGQWQDFVDREITPRFPAGLSVLTGDGQWREASGKIAHEPSRVLVILHPDCAAAEGAIDEIRGAYCRQFRQEAVMKVTMPARVAF